MKILLLGAAGAMARVAVRDLIENKDVETVGLADLRLETVREMAAKLGDQRLVPIQSDAKDPGSLSKTLKGWDAVINSTWYELNLKVMGAAIEAGVHYLDLGGLYHMTLKQLDMSRQAEDAGVTCVLGLGSSPGVTNLMAMVGAQKLDSIEEVKVRVGGAAIKPPSGVFNPPYSFRTILDEACLPAAVLRDGKIEMVPGLSTREEFVLPDPVGRVAGYYTLHSELATLPQNMGKGVREMNFIVAFAPDFTKALHVMVSLGLASKEELQVASRKVVPYDLLTHLVDSIPRSDEVSVDYGVRRVEILGSSGGKPSRLTYDCISGPHAKWGIGGRALGTGVPASLGAQWLAAGRVKRSGVLPPELCIDGEAFLHELSTDGRGINSFEDDGTTRRAF